MLTCRDQQAAAYKGSRKINRPATHPIHFAADSPDKIIATLRKRGPPPPPKKPCSWFAPDGANSNDVSYLHNFTEELSCRQEVQ